MCQVWGSLVAGCDGVACRFGYVREGSGVRDAVKGKVFESPLNEHGHAALKLNDVDEVDEEPHEPGKQPGNVETENVGDCGGTANDRHFAFV